jgi:short-subunit dehydrogenase
MRSMVFITGATGGLGKAFSVECARRGWDLFLTDQDRQALDTLASALKRAYGIRVIVQPCDLTRLESRQALFQRLDDTPLRFKGLINVAGVDFEGLFRERSRQQIRGIIRLNIEATLEVTHRIMPAREPMQPFWIVTVSSLAAFFPIPVKATYAASKRFLLNFFLALRDEVEPEGATVTVLCPGGLPTNDDVIEAIEAQGLVGQLTTQNIGRVAKLTIDSALQGKAVVVPGAINQIMRWLGSLIPPLALSRFLGRRWRAARKKRAALEEGGLPAPVESRGSL